MLKKKRITIAKNQSKEQIRKRAIELFNNNWRVSEICETLNCSKRWIYK
ncbi:MAG: helix-turn-helix domain-containing protein [Melioribacteraceae bacterium]|nr:helix-turn-helix domain-containing protein [Melioribacteraceae bacterium]MCF8356291.1 helix-turn-helix domain-containing protein [Melioribacteraceae bacterium]MCF8394259.1 helix-turn-helix domain-containing protein [Melioribacteraceae bacterium]MCF8419980.1 helix-turn-helix domain-containing protein [Melioribacteraceae bacterium]